MAISLRPSAYPFCVELLQAMNHFESAVAGAQRVVALRVRRPPECHDGVADVFIERAQVFEDDLGHLTQVFVQQAHQFVGGHAFGKAGEAANVAEHDGQFLGLAAGANVFLRISFDQRNHAGRQVLREGLADLPLFAFLEDHAEACDHGVVRHQSAGGDDKAEPPSHGGEAEIDEPSEYGQGAHQRRAWNRAA